MPPIHARVYNRAIMAVHRHILMRGAQKRCELISVHFTRGHSKFTVLDLTAITNMAINLDIIRRVGEHHMRLVVLHQLLIAIQLQLTRPL